MKHSYEVVKLKNGAIGLLIDVPDATVMNFEFNFRAGDYLAPSDKWDTAHIMEHMAMGANIRYKKSSDFSKEFTKNGADSNAYTSTYHMGYEAECADFEAERILDLLCVTIESPLFLESEFKTERANVRDELNGYCNNHYATLNHNLGQAMGLYEISFHNRIKLLANIKLQDINNHYNKTHYGGNLRFIIAGQVKNRKKQIIERIESLAIKSGGERIPLIVEPIVGLKTPLTIKNNTVENIYYRWETALGGVLSDPEDNATAALFGALLSTFHSRIFGKARERGLVYGIGHGRYRTLNNSFWWVGGQVLPENINPLLNLICSELKAVAGGKFSQSEMQSTKQLALGHYQRSAQTVNQLLNYYISRFVFEDRVEDYQKVPQMIAAIDCQQVIDVAKKCLDADNQWGVGFYGAIQKIKPKDLMPLIKNTYIE